MPLRTESIASDESGYDLLSTSERMSFFADGKKKPDRVHSAGLPEATLFPDPGSLRIVEVKRKTACLCR